MRLSKAYKLITNIANSLSLPKYIIEVDTCLSGFAETVQACTVQELGTGQTHFTRCGSRDVHCVQERKDPTLADRLQ